MPAESDAALLSPYYRDRVRVGGACVVCFCVMWWAGRLLAIPTCPFYEASLLQQASPVLTIMAVVLLFLLCTAGAVLIAGPVRYNAPLAAALVGLSAISMRCGTSRDAIFHGLATAGSPVLFLVLAGELVLLAIVVGLCAWVLAQLHAMNIIARNDDDRDDEPQPSAPAVLASLGIQTVFTVVLLLLLCTTEAKQQALAGTFLASMLGAMGAHLLIPAGRYDWYWAPPLVIGIFGYIVAWADPRGMPTASLYGPLAALARPLPLDYASAGPAGAIWGYWMAHRWRHRENVRGTSHAE